MNLEPYKGRFLDTSVPVRVYRNLNKKGVVYSIQQNKQVVAYATEVALKDCVCRVNLTALARVRKKKVREVHAWVEGYFTELFLLSSKKLSYNPYKHDHFYNIHDGSAVKDASYMLFTQSGVRYIP
jgi:hypothetical protein